MMSNKIQLANEKLLADIKSKNRRYFWLKDDECAKLFTSLKRFLPGHSKSRKVDADDEHAQINDLNMLLCEKGVIFRAMNGAELASISKNFPDGNAGFSFDCLLPWGLVDRLSKIKTKDDMIHFYCTPDQVVLCDNKKSFVSSYIPAWPNRKLINYNSFFNKLDPYKCVTLEVDVPEMRKAFKFCKDSHEGGRTGVLKREGDKWLVKSDSLVSANPKYYLNKVVEKQTVENFKYIGLPLGMFDKFQEYKTITMQFCQQDLPVRIDASENEKFLIMPMIMEGYIDEEEWGDL